MRTITDLNPKRKILLLHILICAEFIQKLWREKKKRDWFNSLPKLFIQHKQNHEIFTTFYSKMHKFARRIIEQFIATNVLTMSNARA